MIRYTSKGKPSIEVLEVSHVLARYRVDGIEGQRIAWATELVAYLEKNGYKKAKAQRSARKAK